MAAKERGKHEVRLKQLITQVKERKFAPFYIFAGEEPYYADRFIEVVESEVLQPHEKEFNYFLLYGNDVTAERVVEVSRQYPMMSAHLVVIVNEAQLLTSLDSLAQYFEAPLSSTILILSFNGKNIDKRTLFYKNAIKGGELFEATPLREFELYNWIEEYLKERNVAIEPDAIRLLQEYSDSQLRKLALQLDKLVLSLKGESRIIDSVVVEKNTGLSRKFSPFELSDALSNRDQKKAFYIAGHLAANSREYPFPLILGALFSHFLRVLKYHGALLKIKEGASLDIAREVGVPPYFIDQYSRAARNYTLINCMEVVALLKGYDSALKGGDRGEAQEGELLLELCYKIVIVGR